MIKLNDDNIQVGQIKQLLHDFNLPKCPIGEENKEKNKHFIQDTSIYLCKENDIKRISNYLYNQKYLNLTHNLKISNMIYDRYTHRYLGNYLRFIRDYKKLDLMSMYNCFDGDTLKYNLYTQDKVNDSLNLVMDTSVNSYFYYKIPIKARDYTLFLNTSLPISICLHFENINDTYDLLLNQIHYNTYSTIACQPYKCFDIKNIIENLKTKLGSEFTSFFERYKDNLQLVLKIPKDYKNYIVLLEKAYKQIVTKGFGFIHDITGEYMFSGNWLKPQLCTNSTNLNLLADRLIEYLTGNVISNQSEDYDISKLQSLLIKNNIIPADHVGYWGNTDYIWLRSYIAETGLQNTKYDILGYLDKDIEMSLYNVSKEGLI